MLEELNLKTSDLAPHRRLLTPQPPGHARHRHYSPLRSNDINRRHTKSAIPWGQERQHTNIIYRMGAFNYARHNPHPRMVRHVKGLLDLPMCYVETLDSGLMQPQVIPPHMNIHELKSYSIPNINSQNMPLNTLNGLPLLNFSKEQEVWRKELKSLTEAVLLPSLSKVELEDVRHSYDQLDCHPYPICRPRTPSILLQREKPLSSIRLKTPSPSPIDMAESRVFQLLSQLLEAGDSSSVQTWLCTASDDEKWYALQQLTTAFQNTLPSAGDKHDALYKTDDNLSRENPHLSRVSTSLSHIVECDESQNDAPAPGESSLTNRDIRLNGQKSPQIDSAITEGANENEISLLQRPSSMGSERNAILPLTERATSRPSTSSRPRTSISRQIQPALSVDSKSEMIKTHKKSLSNQSIQVDLTNSLTFGENSASLNPSLRYVNASSCLRNQNLVRTTRNFHPNYLHVRSSVA